MPWKPEKTTPIAPLRFLHDWQLLKRSRCGMFLSSPKRSVQLGAFVTETAHGVTGVASLILLADIGDQRLRALHFDFERGDQCIFGVNNNVSRFALNFKANRKLHLCLPLSMFKNIAQFSCEVELLGPVPFSMCEDMTKPDGSRRDKPQLRMTPG